MLNREKLERAMREKGYGGVAALARAIGVHRNSLGRYLRGEQVLPKSVQEMIERLGLRIQDAFIQVSAGQAYPAQEITALIDTLQSSYPKAAYVLFGSRARGTNRSYSDFDLGVFSRSNITLDDYLALIGIKEQFEDELPYFIDLVNLNNADRSFLTSIDADLVFLGGRYLDWMELKKRAEQWSKKVKQPAQ